MGGSAVLLESFTLDRSDRSLLFTDPLEEVAAQTPGEVLPALERIRSHLDSGGYAAGFIGYEAAAGLDPDYRVHHNGDVPCLWFGLFHEPRYIAAGSMAAEAGYELSGWDSSISETAYRQAVDRIQQYLVHSAGGLRPAGGDLP